MIAIKNATLVMRDHFIPDAVLLVEDGKIAEHWDVMEPLAAEDTWQNRNGKF